MNLLTFILACWGNTLIITKSRIFEFFRSKFDKNEFNFFRCPMCVGFWVGVFWAVLSHNFLGWGFKMNALSLIQYGCISAATSYSLSVSFSDEGIKICNFGHKKEDSGE